MQLSIDEDKLINSIITLESELKHFFKVLKNEDKIYEKEFDSICLLGTMTSTLCGNLKVHKTFVNNTLKFRTISSAISIPTYFLLNI